MLPISVLMMVLAVPISRVVYERYAFRPEDSLLTATVLMAYSVGMFVYLGRDVLVRVFYALEDSLTPFRISIANIFLNALLDFLLVRPYGAVGLVLATVGVNLVSMLIMLAILHRRLQGLPLRQWGGLTALLAMGSGLAGAAAWAVLRGCERLLGNQGFGVLLVNLCIAGSVGLLVFALFAMRLRLPEVDALVSRLSQRFLRR